MSETYLMLAKEIREISAELKIVNNTLKEFTKIYEKMTGILVTECQEMIAMEKDEIKQRTFEKFKKDNSV